MSLAFIDRDPTPQEIEKFRLILSTYQDGAGQLAAEGSSTLPGWRDFERAIAAAFGGQAQENKYIFDVLLPATTPNVYYSITAQHLRDPRKCRTGLSLSYAFRLRLEAALWFVVQNAAYSQ
jgi:hypothetical protein